MITTIVLASIVYVAQPGRPETQKPARTQWSVRAMPGLEMALLIGPLSGDPLVLRRNIYADERAWADRSLGPDAKEALRQIRRIVDNEDIVTAFLALYLSAGPTKTLDDVIATVARPEAQLERLAVDPNWDPRLTRRFHRLRKPLLTVLRAFAELKLPALYERWQARFVARKIAELTRIL